MRDPSLFDKIDIHLIRVLHTVLTERSVSRAALKLGMHQPAVSAALKRLREAAGDPLLVRSGAAMVPTDAGLRMVEPCASMLRAAEALFTEARGFDPRTSDATLRIAASDYLDPLFLPSVVARIKAEAPHVRVEVHSLSGQADFHEQLAQGQVDVVVANWLSPTESLHRSELLEDEVACLVSRDHPAARRGWKVADWLEADHVAPMPTHPGARGVIDEHLAQQGLKRRIGARCAHFSLIPAMVAQSLLVLTTGRQYCERFTSQLPVTIVPCPVEFPRLVYYQLWHERSHASASARWLRERIRLAAAGLKNEQATTRP